jgi:hypothetical protein
LEPVENGANVKVIVQDPPGATLLHAFVPLKWVPLEPQRLTDVTTRFASPVFDTVTVLDTEVLFAIVPKLIEVGETEMFGPPLAAAACVTVKVWPAMVMVPVREDAAVLALTE